jgi:hypothetical protein
MPALTSIAPAKPRARGRGGGWRAAKHPPGRGVRLHPRAARQYNAIGRLAREDPENEPIRKRRNGPGRRRRVSLRGQHPSCRTATADTTRRSHRSEMGPTRPHRSHPPRTPRRRHPRPSRPASRSCPLNRLRRRHPASRCCRSQRRATTSSETSTCALALCSRTRRPEPTFVQHF